MPPGGQGRGEEPARCHPLEELSSNAGAGSVAGQALRTCRAGQPVRPVPPRASLGGSPEDSCLSGGPVTHETMPAPCTVVAPRCHVGPDVSSR